MKQMRSRFRLLTLLIVCAFLVTVVLCTGHVLKTAGISLSSLSLPLPGISVKTSSGSAFPDGPRFIFPAPFPYLKAPVTGQVRILKISFGILSLSDLTEPFSPCYNRHATDYTNGRNLPFCSGKLQDLPSA